MEFLFAHFLVNLIIFFTGFIIPKTLDICEKEKNLVLESIIFSNFSKIKIPSSLIGKTRISNPICFEKKIHGRILE